MELNDVLLEIKEFPAAGQMEHRKKASYSPNLLFFLSSSPASERASETANGLKKQANPRI